MALIYSKGCATSNKLDDTYFSIVTLAMIFDALLMWTCSRKLIHWQCGTRDSEDFKKMYNQLKRWNVKVYFSDKYSVYRDLIAPERLIQTKSETNLIFLQNGIGLPISEEKLTEFHVFFT